jgi:hypothetical protein
MTKHEFIAIFEKVSAEMEAEMAEKEANRGPVIGFYNRKGGVGSTTLAYHACILARERGLSLAVASTDPTAELHRWLELEPRSPSYSLSHDVDLAIIDVHSHTEELSWDVDVWVVPIVDRRSFEHACAVSDQIVGGDIFWLPNIQPALLERAWSLEVPEHLREEVKLLPAIPRSVAIAKQVDQRQSVWACPSTAETKAARVLRATLAQVLDEALTWPDESEVVEGFARSQPADEPSSRI